MRVSKDVGHILVSAVRDAAAPLPDLSGFDTLGEILRHGIADAILARDDAAIDPIRALLEGARFRTIAHNARLIDAALRVQGALDDVGLRSLGLKGLAFADRDGGAQRSMADADLLVGGDISVARRAIEPLGFRLIDEADHAHAYEETASGVIVELHRSVTSCPGFFPVSFDELWRRRRSGLMGLVVPSNEDLLVLLGLHAAFQHGFVLRLVQYLDFRRLLEDESLDLVSVERRAAEWRAAPGLCAALHVADGLVGLPPRGKELARALPEPPSRLVHWTQRAASEPSLFLAPRRARLAFVRLSLARGRRLELVRRTLGWPERDEPRRWARAGAIALRGLRLTRQLALRTLSS